MTQKQFYDWQTDGGAQDVFRLVAALEERDIEWCMIGGLAVNHWALEPMTTADVDLVIVADKMEEASEAMKSLGFSENRFQWSINFKGKSNVSIQISTEELYLDFPSRAVPAIVHGILMKVASLEDTLAAKLAAYQDPERRPTKKLKDILDIARLVDAHPHLAASLPDDLRNKLNP